MLVLVLALALALVVVVVVEHEMFSCCVLVYMDVQRQQIFGTYYVQRVSDLLSCDPALWTDPNVGV